MILSIESEDLAVRMRAAISLVWSLSADEDRRRTDHDQQGSVAAPAVWVCLAAAVGPPVRAL
jgi:hypothetical protein